MEGIPKPVGKLESQLLSANERFGADLIPQHSSIEDLITSPLPEIKEKYAERYKAYVTLLRKMKNEEKGFVTEDEVLRLRNWIQSLNNLEDYIIRHESEGSILRDRQATVFEDIRNSLERGHKDGYVKLPTGVGKTVLFSQIVEAMGQKTLIVVPTRLLINQTGEKLDDFTNIDYGHYYSGGKELGKDVTIITYASLRNLVDSGELNPDEYPLLILDEAHKALGAETQKTIRMFSGIKLGFTATPEYNEYRNLQLLLHDEIHSMSIVEAVESNLLSPFKVLIAETDTDLSQVEVVGGKYNEQQLEKAINTESRNQGAVSIYKELFRGQSAIAYCGTVHHAIDLANKFKENSVRAVAISGRTPLNERRFILEQFKAGNIDVLCNAQLLIEGFDEPRVSVVINAVPTLSKVEAEQRAGRCLRLDPDNPAKVAYVVDIMDKNSKNQQLFSEIAAVSESNPPLQKDDDPSGRLKTFEEFENRIGRANLVIEHLRITYQADEVLSISNRNSTERTPEEMELPPEGWATASSISKRIGRYIDTVKEFAETYRNGNPGWFKDFRAGNRMAEHYSPELVTIVQELLKNTEFKGPPEGWLTASQLTGELNRDLNSIKRFAEQYKETNPEWFGMYRSLHTAIEHYSPVLVEKIREGFGVERAPDGWLPFNPLMKELGIGPKRLRDFIAIYKQAHPESVQTYLSNTMTTEFFAPELITSAKEKLKQIPPPAGWINTKDLSTALNTDFYTIQEFAEQFREGHPDWFQHYKSSIRATEHYSPELVQMIRDSLQVEDAPADWKNKVTLSKELGVSRETIENFIQKYRESNSDWFKQYRGEGKKKRISEYVSPQLIALIKEKLGIERTPAGWKTINMLHLETGADQKSIQRFLETYRISNPDQFKNFKSHTHTTEHFSPFLVEKVREHFGVKTG